MDTKCMVYTHAHTYMCMHAHTHTHMQQCKGFSSLQVLPSHVMKYVSTLLSYESSPYYFESPFPFPIDDLTAIMCQALETILNSSKEQEL